MTALASSTVMPFARITSTLGLMGCHKRTDLLRCLTVPDVSQSSQTSSQHSDTSQTLLQHISDSTVLYLLTRTLFCNTVSNTTAGRVFEQRQLRQQQLLCADQESVPLPLGYLIQRDVGLSQDNYVPHGFVLLD